MPFISPMLASPLPDGFLVTPGRWFVEEKFDGHRLIMEVIDTPADLFHKKTVRAWSRDGLHRPLPPQIVASAQLLSAGLYDGELMVPGRRFNSVTRLDQSAELVYTIFDVLDLHGEDCRAHPWTRRRDIMTIATMSLGPADAIRLSIATLINGNAEVQVMAAEVWKRGGEGLILKAGDSLYEAGKRRKTWIKIKALFPATLEVIGFAPGRLGPVAVTLLVDDEGNKTRVKTKDTATRTLIEVDPARYIGRRLVIEHQGRTDDGNYVSPMWDRWEDE